MDVRVAWAESVTSDPPCILGILCRDLKISVIRDTQISKTLLPNDHVFCRDIFGLAAGNFALNIGGVQWGRYLYNKARGGQFRVEIGLDRDDIRDTGGSNLVHGGQHFDGELHI